MLFSNLGNKITGLKKSDKEKGQELLDIRREPSATPNSSSSLADAVSSKSAEQRSARANSEFLFTDLLSSNSQLSQKPIQRSLAEILTTEDDLESKSETPDNKMNKEELKKLSSLPETAEKYLKLLLAYYEHKRSKKGTNEPTDHFFSQEMLNTVYQSLAQHIDELLSYTSASDTARVHNLRHYLTAINKAMSTYAQTLDSSVSQSSEKISFKKVNPSTQAAQVISAINSLKELVCPLDTDLTIELLKDNIKAAKDIPEQKVTVILGNTGSGKTTLVHFLAGSTFELTRKGHYKITPKNSALESFITSGSAKSETRRINAVTVDGLMLCDTPGYKDTRGPETDIANGIGVADAVMGCDAVSVIVLINKTGVGERYQYLETLVSEISKFLDSIDDGKVLESFIYIYPNFSFEDRDAIIEKITEFHTQAELVGETKKAMILQDMLNKISADEHGETCFLDPLTSNREALFNKIAATPVIENPSEVFRQFVLKKSIVTLEKQVNLILADFKQAFLTGNVTVAQYKYDQLAELNHLLPAINVVTTVYAELNRFIETTVRNLETKVDEIFVKLHKPSADDHLDALTARFNVYVQYYYHLRSFRDHGAELQIFSDERDAWDLFFDNLKAITADPIKFCQLADLEEGATFHWTQIAKGFKLLHKFQETFTSSVFTVNGGYDLSSSFSKIYNKAQKIWSERFQEWYQQAVTALHNNQLDDLVTYANMMSEIDQHFVAYLLPEQQGLYKNLVQEINLYFITSKKAIDYYVGTEPLNIETEENCTESKSEPVTLSSSMLIDLNDWSKVSSGLETFYEPMHKLWSVVNTTGLDKHMQDNVKQDYLSTVANAKQYFNAIISHLKTNRESLDQEEVFKRFDQVLACLIQLAPLDEAFSVLSNDLKAYLVETFNEYEAQLNALCEELTSKQQSNLVFSAEDVGSLAELYRKLETMRFSVVSLRSVFADKLYTAKEQQKKFIKQLFDDLDTIKLLVNAPAEQLYDFLVKLSSIDVFLKSNHPLNHKLELFAVDDESQRKESVERKKLNGTLRNLSTIIAQFSMIFDTDKIDVSLEEYINIFRFLYLCKTSKDFEFLLLKNPISEYLASFHVQLSQWNSKINKTLWKNFGILTSGGSESLSPEVIAQKQQAAKNIAAALLQLIKLIRLCNEKQLGTEYENYIKSSTEILKGYLESDTPFKNFMIGLKKEYATKPFEISAIYGWLGIISEFKCLDECLQTDEKFAALSEHLIQKATERENSQLIALRECIQHNQYATFVSLYKDINNEAAANFDSIVTSLENIAESALGNIREKLTFASQYTKQSFTAISAEELKAYFSCIAELKNYLAVSAFLNNHQHTAINTEIQRLLTVYNKQVVEFEHVIKTISDNDYQNLHAGFSHVRTALDGLPTGEADVHFNLNRCIEANNFRLINLLTAKCNRYDTSEKSYAEEESKTPGNIEKFVDTSTWGGLATSLTQKATAATNIITSGVKSFFAEKPITIQEYSDELFTLFNFLESICPQYNDIYTQLIRFIVNEIRLFTASSCRDDYGWDLEEKYNFYKQIEKFIPQVVQSNVKKRIEQLCSSFTETKAKELAKFDSYLIGKLMSRLLKTKNDTYAKMVKARLELLIGEAIDGIELLLHSKQYDEAVISLDKVWLHINYCSAKNSNVSPSEWQINPKLLSGNYTQTLKTIIDRFVSVSTDLTKDLTIDDSSFLLLKNSLSTIKAFVSLFHYYNKHGHPNTLYVHIFTPTSQNTKNRDAYLAAVQKIINFALQIKGSFSQSLSKNDFETTAHVMRLLKTNDQTLQELLLLILEPDARTYFQALHIDFGELLTANSTYCSYEDMRAPLQQRYHLLSQLALLSVDSDSRFTSASDDDKKSFHRDVFQAYEGLIAYNNAGIYQDLVGQDKISIEQKLAEAKENITRNLSHIIVLAVEVVSASDFPGLDEQGYQVLNTAYRNLIIAKEEAKDPEILVIIDQNLEALKQTVQQKLRAYVQTILSDKNIALSEFMQCLFKLKTMSLNAGQFAKDANVAIEHLLTQTQTHHFTQCNIVELSTKLQEENTNHEEIAKLLLNDHKIFSSFVTELRNNKTAAQDIHYVSKALLLNPANTDLNQSSVEQLTILHDHFYTQYWSYVLTQLNNDDLLESGQSKADFFVSVVLEGAKVLVYTYEDKLVNLAAGLFAYWSITEYENRAEAAKATQIEQGSILQPHPTQIVAIFRLLGLGTSRTDDIGHNFSTNFLQQASPYLTNHLAEIKTGEGKSVTLAITAMILALMGYEVDCACYSHYLSQRDYDDFYKMFKAFGLEHKIVYGTFDYLSERLILEKHGNLRPKVDSILRQTGIQTAKKSEKIIASVPRILLLDEVDVFFSPNFCGRTYKLAHMFPHDAVFKLIKYIWENAEKKAALNLKIIVQDNPEESGYRDLIDSLVEGSEVIVKNAIAAMLQDVVIYRTQKGNFHFDRTRQIIGYKQGHDIVYNVALRYQTMFAYVDKLKRREITHPYALRGKIGLLIECGEFSYAEIPRLYEHVLGATATLQGLCNTENELLDKILTDQRSSTYVPSAYGRNNLRFYEPSDLNSSLMIVDEEQHFQAITHQIIERRQVPQNSTLFFPIMVFLAPEKLKRYYDYLQAQIQTDSVPFAIDLLDQSTPEEEKHNVIHRANMSGKVTLIHKEFGRGTNFRCDNKTINGCGGPVVILSSFPATISEEIQECGRTARQGDNGSVVMLLSAEDIHKEYRIEPERSKNLKGKHLYETLSARRASKIQQEQQNNKTKFHEIIRSHEASMAFFSVLKQYRPALFVSNELQYLMQFLAIKNQFDASLVERIEIKKPEKVFRTVFCIDATGSMNVVIEAAKKTVRETFKRALAVVEENKNELEFAPKIEMKFVFYRNYSSLAHLLLQPSNWYGTENIHALETFLSSVCVSGGMGGNEAVEVAFAHVNKLLEEPNHNIQQIIWIGDMPANTETEVNERRKGVLDNRTTYDWNKIPGDFQKAVYFDKELEKIKNQKVSINAYWVKGSYYEDSQDSRIFYPGKKYIIEAAYTKVARETGGKYGLLDVNGQNAATDIQALTNVITTSILNAIGGEKLVEQYRVKYDQSYTGACEAVSASAPVSSTRASMFGGSSSVTVPIATAAMNAVLIIPRDEIKTELVNYLETTSMFFNRSGRSEANKLLQMVDNPDVTDEQLSNEMRTWFTGGKTRATIGSKYTTFKI